MGGDGGGVQEEGLDAMWNRHTEMHHMLWDGLRSMNLEPYVENEQERLVTVNTIKVRRLLTGLLDAVSTADLKTAKWIRLCHHALTSCRSVSYRTT